MNTTVNKLITPQEDGKSYWNGTGAYQKPYELLYDATVPESGSAKTLNGELIRAISRLQHEYYNNGNCNAQTHVEEKSTYTCMCCNGKGWETCEDEHGIEYQEDCDHCDGTGEVEEEDYVLGDEPSPFYKKFIDLVKKCVPDAQPYADGVEDIICSIDRCKFSKEEAYTYVRMMDEVIHYVIENQNNDQPIPDWYQKD